MLLKVHSDEVKAALERAHEQIAWIRENLAGIELKGDHRHRIPAQLFDLAIEHGSGIHNLIAANICASAFALVRSEFECFVRGAWRHLQAHRELLLVALREMPTHLEQAREAVARVLVPTTAALASYVESRIDPKRAKQISTLIAVRGLIGMTITAFLVQEILGAGRVQPVPEELLTKTIAELFLRGVAPEEVEGA